MSESSAEFDSVELRVDEFLDRFRRGERPSLVEFAAEHPAEAERIRSLIPAVLALEEIGPDREAGIQSGPGQVASPSLMPQRLGDYVLVRPIGSGGMGVVYEAIQESLGRHVALKTIPSRQPEDATRLERFRREALAAARLHHPHIVPVFGIGEHQGLHFYTMQFIRGDGLDRVLREVDRLRRDPASLDIDAASPGGQELSKSLARGLCHGHFLPRSPLGTDQVGQARSPISTTTATRPRLPGQTEARYVSSVAWIGVQVAEALDYAHQQGVLHRDIKPSNLLLDAQGHVWVTDFGLAKTHDGDELTRTGDVVGTLRYMAPERFNGWSDPRSDLFALGATLYELLTTRPAFDESDRIRLVDRLLHGSPVPLRQIDRRVPRDLETIVLKALAHTPGDRYATAGRLAEDLRRFLAGRPILARRSGAIERGWRWCRRNPVGATAAVIVAGALAAAAAMSMIYASEQTRAASEIGRLAANLAQERESLRTSLAESRRILAMRNFDRGQAAFEKNQISVGLLWMMASWRSAIEAEDRAWQRAARANVSAWCVHLPRLEAVLSHEGPVDAAAFGPDGRTILTGGDDFVARLWDADTGRPIGRPLRHPGTVYSVAIGPDGRIALTGAGDGLVRLWDLARGLSIAPPLPHRGEVSAVAFHPHGRTVVMGGTDSTARLWDIAAGRPIGSPLASGRPVTSLAFRPDGSLVATASRDGNARLWDASDGRPVGGPLSHGTEVLAVVFSPDGRTLLTGSRGGFLRGWDVETGRPIGAGLRLHRGHIRALAFGPDGHTYLTGSEDKSARLWDATTHQPLGPPLMHQGPVVAVAFRPDGRSFLTASSDHTVRVWAAESLQHSGLLQVKPGAGQAVAFLPDGKSWLAVCGDGTARLWDRSTGSQIGPDMGSRSAVTSVACSPDGKLVLVGGDPARLWNAASGRPVGQALRHPGGASVVAFSPDGQLVLTGGPDRTTRLWDAATGAPIGAPIGHTGSVDAVAFRPDGKAFLAGCDAGTAQVWDVATGTPVGHPLRHPGAVSAAAYSPDGTTLITGCEDGTARLWDLGTGGLRVPPLTHQAWVFAVAFSPDGTTVLTGSRDRTARLWDAATGQPIGPPWPHPNDLWSVRFAPDGQSFLTGDTGETARLFGMAPPLPDDAELVATRVEFLTGLRLDPTQGLIHVLDNATWRSTRDRSAQQVGSSRSRVEPRLQTRSADSSTGATVPNAPIPHGRGSCSRPEEKARLVPGRGSPPKPIEIEVSSTIPRRGSRG